MAKRALELEVMRGSQHVAVFDAEADPDDVGSLRASLTGWLTSNGWKRPLWGRFELLARNAGEYRVLKRVRADP